MHIQGKVVGNVRRHCQRPFLVRSGGLEPPRRKSPDPKSGAATNYATSANADAKIRIYLL